MSAPSASDIFFQIVSGVVVSVFAGSAVGFPLGALIALCSYAITGDWHFLRCWAFAASIVGFYGFLKGLEKSQEAQKKRDQALAEAEASS